MGMLAKGIYRTTAPTLVDNAYENIQLDGAGNLKTTDAPNTSVITVANCTALTWYKHTPPATSRRLTFRPTDTTKYCQVASSCVHKITDATTTTAPAGSDAATDYALSIELQGDHNTHVASTTYHLAAGQLSFPVHKVADATTITATNPANSTPTDYALSIELIGDHNTHTGSTTYHITTTAAATSTAATSEATLVAQVNACRAAMLAHYGDVATHGGVGDPTALAAVTATANATNAATARTTLNALAAAHVAHMLLGGNATTEATLVAQVNAMRANVLAHLSSTASHYEADAVNLAVVQAAPVATNAASARTLNNAIRTAMVSHYTMTTNNAHEKYAAAQPIVWDAKNHCYVLVESNGTYSIRTDA